MPPQGNQSKMKRAGSQTAKNAAVQGLGDGIFFIEIQKR
jgi:hypothetical protein